MRPDLKARSKLNYVIILFVLSAISVGTLYWLNLSGRRSVEARAQELAASQGETIGKLMNKAAASLLANGEGELLRFMDEIAANEQVVYVAVKRAGALRHARTKFEGYLPLDDRSLPVKMFLSPLGEIIEVATDAADASGRAYSIHIGYLFSAIDAVRGAARRNFLTLTSLQAGIVLVVILLLAGFDRRLLRQEMEIRRQKEEKEIFQEISLVASGINHELRNPLNALYLNLQMLDPLLDRRDPEVAFHGDGLKREIKRIQEIVERFSSMSRSIAVRRETIDVEKFFGDLESVWKGMARRPVIRTRCRKPLTIDSDRGLLTQILVNLVSNAAESGAGRVDIDAAAQKGKAVFSIRDDGPGMAREQLDKIFDPFVTFKSGGSGIGLALTRKMVALLDGRIEVASREGQGTEFKVFL
jgi:signal transduction histidine kinase